ncbi:hypothetical protein DFJ77DRAFT_529484 [Powellomyces hirtus]|nr:hypothetical protein DFJ77DRAFT_529484 [Powellomyces hirtus]
MSTSALPAPKPAEHQRSGRRTHQRRKQLQKPTLLLPLSKGADGPFLNLSAPPKDLLHPLLGRMTPASLRSTFDNEIIGCIKRMRIFASQHTPEEKEKDSPQKYKALLPKKLDPATVPLHVSPNTRRRLLSSQLTKCWEMFGPHVDQEYLYTRMIEAGESILTIDGFWDIANTACFEQFLERAPKTFKAARSSISVSLFPSTQAVTPGFSIPTLPLSSPRTLSSRARYGQLVFVTGIMEILREIMDVVGECFDLPDDREVSFLVWQGTRSVRAICETIGTAGWWQEVPDILTRSLSRIEGCPSLTTLPYIGWRLDLYVTVHRSYMNHDAHEQAEELINDAMTKVEDARRDAVYDADCGDAVEAPVAEIEDVVSTAMYRLNVLIFGCELRAMVDGKQIANGEAIVPGRSAVPGSAVGARQRRASITAPRQSISIPNADIETLDDLRKSVVTTQTPLRKLLKECPIRGGTFWPEEIKKTTTASIHDLTISRQHLAQSFSVELASVVSFQTDATGDLVWKPKAGGRTLVRTLSMKAVSQLRGKRRIKGSARERLTRPPMQKDSLMSISDVETGIAFGIPDEAPLDEDDVPEPRFEDLNPSHGREQAPVPTRGGRKMKTALPKVDESEDGRVRRQILFDVLYMLASFQGDRDRFHAVVEGLNALSSSTVKLTFIERLSDDFNRKEQLFMRMLDVGFDIILSNPEEFLTPSKVMAAYTTDMELGRPPQPADVTRLIVHQRLAQLNLDDLIGFCRKLFEYHQWERFSVLARILDGMFDTDAFNSTSPSHVQEAVSRELVLRLAAINFQNVMHSERRVGFSNANSAENINGEQFAVSNHLHAAAIALLDALADCIETDSLVSRYPRLFVDTARLLWDFLEPMLRSVNSTADASQCSSLTTDSMMVILLRSLHAVLTELPSEDSFLLVDVGGKLALLLECMGCVKEAVEVLEDIEAVISIARCRFGEPADGITSVTFNINFHKIADPQSEQPIPDDHSRKGVDGAAKDSQLVARRNLACAAVGVYRRLFRCHMKLSHETLQAEQKKKVAEYTRLTNKHMAVSEVLTHVNEERASKYCGENLVLRSLTLAVHASEGSNLNKEAKKTLLTQAVGLLRTAYRDEKRLLTEVTRDDTTPVAHTPLICPAPLFIRRSPTSITVRAVHMRNAANEPVIPHSYQLYCRKVTDDSVPLVTISDVAYPGSGYYVRVGRGDSGVEMTVTGLTQNRKYVFAVCAFDVNGRVIGKGIGETSRPILACLPLPLLLCWGTLANIAHEAQCGDIADVAHKVLKDHYVSWLAPDERLRRTVYERKSGDPYSEAMFKLNDVDLATTAPTVIRAFIESIYASIDREFSRTHAIVYSDVEGMSDTLTAQMLRLKCCRELLIALELAKRIEDERLMLLSSFKCYELLVPLLQMDDVADPTKLQLGSSAPVPLPYIIQILMTCHTTFIKCSAVLGNDRLNGVIDHYSYLAFHLVRRLTARRMPSDLARAVQIAEEALSLIHSVAGAYSDIRILSSVQLEADWLGPEHRAAKRRISKKKGKGRSIITECAYHALLAPTAEFGKGYNLHRARRLEAVCEYLDVEIGRATLVIPPPGQPSARKGLDATNTTIRDIYAVLALSGPDVAIDNITRFRKNPRYIEIMALAAGWCLAAGNFIDTAIRICLDAEDWTEKRNYCLLKFDELAADEEEDPSAAGKKDGWWSKKKKKSMFADKTAGLTSTKAAEKKRGRKPIKEPPPAKKAAGAKVEASVSPTRGGSGSTKKSNAGPPSNTSRSRPTTAAGETNAQSPKSSSHPNSAGLKDSSTNRAASPERSERPKSGKLLEATPSRPGSRPASPERRSRANSANSRLADGVEDQGVRKRQRVVFRQSFLANIPAADRDKVEAAVRVLDQSLAALWHKRRYCRRLRLVVEYEAPSRARLLLVHGLASLAHLERDATGRDFGASEAVARGEPEAYELRTCGRMILEDFTLPKHMSEGATPPTPHTHGTHATEVANHEAFRFVMDSFQAVVQSVVIAARVGDWMQVVDSVKHLWKLQRRLMRRNIIIGADFRRNNLWRAWWVVGLCILDFLQSVNVRKADSDDETMLAAHMPSSRPSTGRSFTYPSRPVTATFCRKDRAGSVLPFNTLSEMTGHQYVAGWADSHGEMQSMFVDIPFLAQCSLFTIEAMATAKKFHRLMEFALKFDQVFRGTYAPLLQPILTDAHEALQAKIGEDSLGPISDQVEIWLESQQFSNSPSQQLWYARGLSAEYRLGAIRPGTATSEQEELYAELVDAYEDAMAMAAENSNHSMMAIAAAEYADVLAATGDRDTACLFWSRAIDAVFMQPRVVADWRSLFLEGNDWATENAKHYQLLVASAGGMKNLIVAAMAATRMVQTRYAHINLDKRQSLVLFAARLFGILLRGSLPHPANPLELAQYTPQYILPYLNLFSDQNRINSWHLVGVLSFLATELIATNRPWEALPLGALMEYLAVHACYSTSILCSARMIKAEVLLHLGAISDGMDCLLSISSGSALLAEEKMFYSVPSSGTGAPLPADVRFQDHVHLLDSLPNLRIVRFIADHMLTDRLIWFIGHNTARDFDLCRSRILIKLMEMAGLGDPGIGQSKLAMLLYQEDASFEEDASQIPEIPVPFSKQGSSQLKSSLDMLGSPANAAMSRAGSSFNIGPGGGGGTRRAASSVSLAPTSRTPRRDANSLLGPTLQRIEVIIGKLVADLQADVQALRKRGKAHFFLKCFEVAAAANGLRWNLQSSVKCYWSIMATIEDLEKQSHAAELLTPTPHPEAHYGVDLGLRFHFQERLITTLILQGSFRSASTEAHQASLLAQKMFSTRFTLIFEHLALMAERHDEIVCAETGRVPIREAHTWVEALNEIEELLVAAGARYGNEDVHARAWEFLGDAMESFGLAEPDKVVTMYQNAEASWKRIPAYHPNRPSGYNATSQHVASLQLKRALITWKLDPNNTPKVLSMLDHTANMCKLSVDLSPNLTVPITLAHANAHAANRLRYVPDDPAYDHAWTAASTKFSDALSGLVSEGGYNLAGIVAALSGVTGLQMDRVTPESDEDDRLLVAALVYQTGRCDGLRRSILKGKASLENSKLKTHDMNPSLIHEVTQWLATSDGGQSLHAGNETSILLSTPSAASELIGPGPPSTAGPTPTIKAQDLFKYMCYLVRASQTLQGSPSDPWELGLLNRIRRVHMCLAEQVGAPYLNEWCMPDNVIPKVDAVTPLVPGSQILPDEATALCWSGIATTTATRDPATATPDCTTGIFVSNHKSKSGPRSAKRQSKTPRNNSLANPALSRVSTPTRATTPGSGSSSTRASIAILPVLILPIRFPTSQLQVIQDILKKVKMVMELSEEDNDFGDEVNDIWESVTGTIRTCFGVADDDILPPPFSTSALDVFTKLFNVETPMHPTTCAAFSYKPTSSKETDIGAVYSWLGRLAAFLQTPKEDEEAHKESKPEGQDGEEDKH